MTLKQFFMAHSMNLEVKYFRNDNLPKGCVPLEGIFDVNNMYKGNLIVDQYEKSFKFNLGSENVPRRVKIGNGTTKSKRDNIQNHI
jgi:hypothetical protein